MNIILSNIVNTMTYYLFIKASNFVTFHVFIFCSIINFSFLYEKKKKILCALCLVNKIIFIRTFRHRSMVLFDINNSHTQDTITSQNETLIYINFNVSSQAKPTTMKSFYFILSMKGFLRNTNDVIMMRK